MLRHRNFLSATLMAATTLFAMAEARAQIRRIDGCTLTTFCSPCNPELPAVSGACTGLPVLQDGWTASQRCFGDIPALESESYLAAVGEGEVIFVTKLKLVPLFVDSQVVVQDLFIVPSRERCAANPDGEDCAPGAPPPILFLDDVVFDFVSPGAQGGPREYLCGVFLPIQEMVDFFGAPPFDLDWFACADLDPFGMYYAQAPSQDTDGNGCLDACVELGAPGRFLARDGIDDVGAGLVNFLLNRADHRLTRIDVFEPQGRSLIRPVVPGLAAGESRSTRPWSFRIVP
jgi:hypothetical protein